MVHQHGTPSCACDHSAIDEGQIVNGSVDMRQFRVLNCLNQATQQVVLEYNSASIRSNEFDPELLIIIPFTSPATLKSFCLLVNDGTLAPKIAKFYSNCSLSTDFTTIESLKPTQSFELAIDVFTLDEEKYFYPMNVPKFSNITSLGILLQGFDDQEMLEVAYLGLKGISSGFKRGVVHAKYESQAQLADHTSSTLGHEISKSNLSS